jgi:phenylpropionate dioxygenase-like ring-hydroxylating dioxygenase large terminal subunit
MVEVLGSDEIQCHYHGPRFGPDGRCNHMPGQDRIPKTACVQACPAVLRHRFIRAWIGDPEHADERRITDLHRNDDPAWIGEGGTIFLQANAG